MKRGGGTGKTGKKRKAGGTKPRRAARIATPTPEAADAEGTRSRRQPAAATPELEQEIGHVRDLLARADADDAGVRFEVAEVVQRVMTDPEKYGKKGVVKLGRQVGLAKRALYNYAQVPAVWSREEFDRILEEKNVLGRPLSWMHFVELSVVEDADKREELRQTALADNLSSRQVHRAITGAKTKPKDATLSALLAGGSRRAKGLVDVLVKLGEAVAGGEAVTEADAEHLAAFRAALTDLEGALDVVRGHVEQLPTPEGPADEADEGAASEPAEPKRRRRRAATG